MENANNLDEKNIIAEENKIAENKVQKPKKGKRVLKKIINWLLYFLVVFGLIWGTPKFLSWALNTEYPMAAITSNSMWPALEKGDLVFIQGINPEKIQVGDIIVFLNKKNAFTIHRVIELRPNTLVTKGDANNVNDKPVYYNDVVGRLYKIAGHNARIPKLGLISIFIAKNLNRLAD